MPEESYRPTLLLLDDEEMVTTSLRNLFRLQSNYKILTYNSPEKALADAPHNPVDLVITDYLMPVMDGITFLSRFKEVQPQAVRVLLTGYADKENAIKAINSVRLYQYIEKRLLIRALEKKIAELDQAHSNLKSIQTELIKAFM